MKQKLIAICGPTSSGKSSLGIKLAKKIGAEIISVDSRQIYRGMDIVTGKEIGEWDGEREAMIVEGVVHFGLDIANPDEDFSAADFKGYAEKKSEEIAARGNVPMLVGGTGFWLQALIDNFDLTEANKDEELRAKLETMSLEELAEAYKELDPEGFETIDTKNKRRLIRAVEVCKLTGKPFSKQQTVSESNYDALQLCIDVPKDVLYERINSRIDVMVGMGLLDEVQSLYEQYGCEVPSMTGIGYRQVCKYIDGLTTFEDAIEEMKKDSRHYAKRQVTWWKRDKRIVWVRSLEEAGGYINKFLK
jgi:tRNA dimethylallyltransferase